MNFDKLTNKSREAISGAQSLALEYAAAEITELHLAYALISDKEGLVPEIIVAIGADAKAVGREVLEAVRSLPRLGGNSTAGREVYASRELSLVLERAEKIEGEMGDEYLSVEHLMLALCDSAGGALEKIFASHGITRAAVLKELKKLRGNTRVTTDTPEGTYGALKKYGQDLVELARSHKLDPVIGRDEEIRNVIRILSRKTKNNPCLIGEPGVGKTASDANSNNE